ncbi:hypothetical protein C5167_031040 [Papaver somniferum]|nr:hypothetical protein C5167_031040 [Papaver somniferum]
MEKINKKRKRQANNQKNISNYKKIEPITPPAPYVIVVHGPPKVGKSLLIKSLVKHYTNHNLTDDTTPGPITIVVGSGEEQRRIQFVECPNNVNGMIDASKYADAIILLIDVSYGFEMETLEFVNLLKVHGMPKLIGVFTNLDCFLNKDVKIEEMRTARFKKLFRNEIHEEAQIFCLSASDEDEKMYLEIDISKLASFILGMEFHPMSWRAANPYVLVDCFEDVTPTERLHLDKNCGKKETEVHIAGVGDFPLAGVASVAEPRPLPHIDDPKIDIPEHLDEETHMKKEIIRVGAYLKFKICDVPCEMVNNRDPCHPILVGGISHAKKLSNARFERHSLYMKSLRTNDPIIVSVGWRRYVTIPIYATEDLHETLEFTPEDKPCCATFWGPFETPGTGVVAVQSLADSKAAFRIQATGAVLGFTNAPYCDINEDHSLFNPLMTSLEPSDRVWTDDTKESEKSKAHVVWGSRERKIADEDLRKKMSTILEDKLKLTCQKRKTDEPWRAVIILERMHFANRAEFLEAYQKKKEQDIRNNITRGMPTRFFERKTGNIAVAN